jgi:hypothetical protein
MMMEAVRTSETSANFNVTTWRYIPEDSKLNIRCCENLKSYPCRMFQGCASLEGTDRILKFCLHNVVLKMTNVNYIKHKQELSTFFFVFRTKFSSEK